MGHIPLWMEGLSHPDGDLSHSDRKVAILRGEALARMEALAIQMGKAPVELETVAIGMGEVPVRKRAAAIPGWTSPIRIAAFLLRS